MTEWIDLLDPTEDEVRKHAPASLQPRALEELLRPAAADGGVHPVLQGHGDYVFGILLAAVIDVERDLLYYQEVDLVVTHDHVLTVRKTPPGEEPFDSTNV